VRHRPTSWSYDLQASDYDNLEDTLQRPLIQLDIGLNKHVVSVSSESTVLDAMKMMREEGVNSVAVIKSDASLLSVSELLIWNTFAIVPDCRCRLYLLAILGGL
jgi:predicted transcriptional regulator